MTTTISAVNARKTLGSLINLVLLRGEEVIISRDGRPVAKLTSVDESGASFGGGKLDLRKARGLGSGLWREVAEGYVRKERDEWT